MKRFLCSLFVLTVPFSAAAEPAKPGPLKVLLVTGGCCHDYEQQKELLPAGLSARAHLDFTVVHEGDTREHKVSIYSDPDWAEGYDVILHNECFGAVTDVGFVEGIAKPHFEGTAGVVLHCSAHSYRHAKTDAWRETVGITSMRHEAERQLKVETVDSSHPVMAGFPAVWETPADELYVVDKEWPSMVPLAKAHGKETDREHPVIWANTYGKGRIFGTTLGHGNETMADPVYLDLVSRGLLWAAGKLNDDGTPADGYGPRED